MHEKIPVDIVDGFLETSKSKYPQFYIEPDKEYFLVFYKYTTGDSESTSPGQVSNVAILYSKEDAYLLAELIEIHNKRYTLDCSYDYRKASDKVAFLEKYTLALDAEFDSYDESFFVFKGNRHVPRYLGYFESLDSVEVNRLEFKIPKKYNLT